MVLYFAAAPVCSFFSGYLIKLFGPKETKSKLYNAWIYAKETRIQFELIFHLSFTGKKLCFTTGDDIGGFILSGIIAG